MRVRHVALPALLTATALAVPAAAQAATLTATVNKACYGTADRVPLSGAGFIPGATVTVTQGPTVLSPSPVADPTGGFSGTAGVQPPARKEVTTSYSATDQTNIAFSQPIRFSQTSIGGRKAGDNGLIQRIRTRGFTTGGRTMYAHVRRGGRNVKTVRIGRLRGACRTLSVKRRFFSRGARPGTYQIYFDTFRRYKKVRQQQLRGSLTVFRIVRSSAAGARTATSASSASSIGFRSLR
jgi:hypothetical protein